MKHIIKGVPFINQRVLPGGESLCFTATSGMLLQHLEDISIYTYNNIRAKYGSSTHASSQLGALQSLGYNAHYTTSLTVEKAKELLLRDIPVGVGWLHHGHVSYPTGFGHWSVIYGFDSTGWYVRDPYGDPDLVNGGWINRNLPEVPYGKSVKYSYKNFNPRWQVEGNGTGYALWID